MAFEDKYSYRAQAVFTPGVPVVFNLNPGLNIVRQMITIKATVTITNAGAAGTPVTEAGAVNLIRRIKVVANKAAGSRYPNGNLCDCSPQSLLRFANSQRDGKFIAEISGSTLGGGVAGAYDIYISIPVYWGDSINLNGVQTALNMNPQDSQGNGVYSAVQVQVELAESLNEIFNGTGGEMAVAGFVGYADDRLDLSGSDTIPLRQEDHEAIIQAPNQQFVDPAMPNDGAFTQWMILAQQGTPGWQLSDAILNRLEIQGSQLNFKQHWQDIRQAMIDDGFWDPSTLTAGLPAGAQGQFFIDWTKGLLGNSNAAAGLQHSMSVNNPSGAGQDRLRIYTRRVYGLA